MFWSIPILTYDQFVTNFVNILERIHTIIPQEKTKQKQKHPIKGTSGFS